MLDRAKGWVCLDVQLDSSQNVCVCVWGGGGGGLKPPVPPPLYCNIYC